MSRDRRLAGDVGVPSVAFFDSTLEFEREGPRKRMLLAGLYHGTNAFLGVRTTLEDFEITREDVLREGGDSLLAGVLEVAGERNWAVLPVLDLHTTLGATVADTVVDLGWIPGESTPSRPYRA